MATKATTVFNVQGVVDETLKILEGMFDLDAALKGQIASELKVALGKMSMSKPSLTKRVDSPPQSGTTVNSHSSSGTRRIAAHSAIAGFISKDNFSAERKALRVSFVAPDNKATEATTRNWAKAQAFKKLVSGQELTLGEAVEGLMNVCGLQYMQVAALISATLSPASRELLNVSAPTTKKREAPVAQDPETTEVKVDYTWVQARLHEGAWAKWSKLPQEFTIVKCAASSGKAAEAAANLPDDMDGQEMSVPDAYKKVVDHLKNQKYATTKAAACLWHNGLKHAIEQAVAEQQAAKQAAEAEADDEVDE